MRMEIYENLKTFRVEKSMTRRDVAEYLNIHESTYGKYELGINEPALGVVIQLADLYSITTDKLLGHIPKNPYDYLTDYESYVLRIYANANDQSQKMAIYALRIGQIKNATQQRDVENSDETADCIFVPVVGRSAAGVPIEMIEDYDDPLALADPKIKPGDFAVIAVGDSMVDAGIRDGDRVIFRQCQDVNDGTIALVAINDGSTIKRFYKTENGYKLMPANSSYTPMTYDKNANIRIIGRFIKVANI
jgi:SOS-response transcriptional repressor LexA/DNA-binding XRE family transcriptional regulator